MAAAIAAGTSRSFMTGVRSTNQTPSLRWSSSSSPTAIASRVLPEPPTAVMITRRSGARCWRSSATSAVATDQPRRAHRQVRPRRVRRRAQRRELALAELKEMQQLVDVAQLVDPEVDRAGDAGRPLAPPRSPTVCPPWPAAPTRAAIFTTGPK